jgi:hypothetical protein
MSTTTVLHVKKYDPIVTIRMPEGVRSAVKKLARDTGDTVTGVILGHLRPFELYASELGQDVLRRIEETVARSTAIHKGAPAYFDAEGRPGHPPVEEWHGIELRNYGTSAEPLWYHTVRQREGQTRAEAVKAYALDLWREWSLLDTEETREKFVDSLEEHHVFVIGYVDFSKWKHFPSTYEAELHRVRVKFVFEPQSPAEVRLYAWCVEWLTGLWHSAELKDFRAMAKAGYRKRATNAREDAEVSEAVLKEPSDTDGFRMRQSLVYYPDCTEEENIQRWAGVSLLGVGASNGAFETVQAVVVACGYTVRRVTIEKTVGRTS